MVRRYVVPLVILALAGILWVGRALLTPHAEQQTPTPTGAASAYTATARVDPPAPTWDSSATVTGTLLRDGQPVSGALMDTTWHYKATTVQCKGKTDPTGVARCTHVINRPAKGYRVQIEVVFTVAGRMSITTTTSFTPQ